MTMPETMPTHVAFIEVYLAKHDGDSADAAIKMLEYHLPEDCWVTGIREQTRAWVLTVQVDGYSTRRAIQTRARKIARSMPMDVVLQTKPPVLYVPLQEEQQ